MDFPRRYKDEFPTKVTGELQEDYWVFNHIVPAHAALFTHSLKVEASAIVFVYRGRCVAEVNMARIQIESPTFVNLPPGSYMQMDEVSEDFKVAVVAMSAKVMENLSLLLRDAGVNLLESRVCRINARQAIELRQLFLDLEETIHEEEHPLLHKSLFYQIVSYFFRSGFRLMGNGQQSAAEVSDTATRLTRRFLTMAHTHACREHNIGYYAERLSVTPKHLSRRVKEYTGCTCSEWIEKYLLLDAKMLLKSTNLSMGQIAERLNFATPSAFGKFFKKGSGTTPLAFRKKGEPMLNEEGHIAIAKGNDGED